jgi:hypothetical protein
MIATSDDWGVTKPDPGFFEKMIEASAFGPAEILYVGDRLDNDIMPAARVGLRTALINRGPWAMIWRDDPAASEVPTLRVDSLAELPGKIAAFNAGASWLNSRLAAGDSIAKVHVMRTVLDLRSPAPRARNWSPAMSPGSPRCLPIARPGSSRGHRVRRAPSCKPRAATGCTRRLCCCSSTAFGAERSLRSADTMWIWSARFSAFASSCCERGADFSSVRSRPTPAVATCRCSRWRAAC